MNKLAEKYFSIGEFASLFKLSKQTLFYYERNNILKPSYIDENGYRNNDSRFRQYKPA